MESQGGCLNDIAPFCKCCELYFMYVRFWKGGGIDGEYLLCMQYASIVLSIDGGRVMTVMECLCGDYAVSPNPGLGAATWT